MDALRAVLEGDSSVSLDAAALALATLEYPELDPAPYISELDRFATELAQRLGPDSVFGSRFVQAANDYLFGEIGFRGNEAEYDDPRNSCLNQVLERRRGLPITLSVVYIEVARRLRQPVCGVGLPGHFLVRYDDGEYSTYIDPFHAGKLLAEKDCVALAREITGVDLVSDPSALATVGVRYIVVRMLNNLRAAYTRARQYAKSAKVLDVLVEYFPSNPEYYKARGLARMKLRALTGARDDFATYLRCSPEADDRAEVKRQIQIIHRLLGRLN
jgi:regulator of sirC expression with transglutaminase-like and TPR domain